MIMSRRSAVAAIALAAVTATGAFAPATAAEFTARIGHLESPLQPRHKALERVAALVKERTGGAVEFKLFPLSQLGGARQMNEGTQLGTIEGTVSPAAFLGGFNPAISILDIPFLLPGDRVLAEKVRQGKFGDALKDSFKNRGFVVAALWPNGRKHFTSNKPLPNIDAFKGQRFRVMNSKILIEQFNALGASAIALPFGELYTSLQNGVVDGQENPLDTIQRMKFHEVQKHLVVSEHGAMEDVALFNPGWWNKLPAKHRAVIIAAFKEVVPQMEKDKAAAQKVALDAIKGAGVKVRVAGNAERAAMRAVMYPKGRAAFLERAGAEGKVLIDLYEAEYKRVVK